MWFFVVLAAVALLGAPDVMAQILNEDGNGGVTNTTDGRLGKVLSQNLYCGTKGLVEGNLGLVIGLLIMFGALWSLMKGGKVMPAIVSILFGAMVTALPSLIESSMDGLSTLMQETGMSTSKTTFEPPYCSGASEEALKELEDREKLENIKDSGMYL